MSQEQTVTPWPGVPAEADAHGQAALLLVESLIHGLIASRTLTLPRAVEIVDTAMDAKVELADESGEPADTLSTSLVLLERIGASLRLDLEA